MEPITHITVLYDCYEKQEELDRNIADAMVLIGWVWHDSLFFADTGDNTRQREITFIPCKPPAVL